ncbi:MAG TPA: tetratricopeptide repeat protein, partial [Thermoanaerobaculia bacterium]
TKAISIAEDPAAYGNLGLCYYLLGDFEKSAAAYRNSVRLRPTVATQWANLADACTWAQQCRDEASAARAKAIELLQRDLAVNPKSARAHGTLAVCLAKAGRAREAATHMSEALELDPNNPSRFYQAARVANLAGKTNDAIAWLKRAEAAGYGAFELQRDPEFAALRGTTAFKTAFNSAGAG